MFVYYFFSEKDAERWHKQHSGLLQSAQRGGGQTQGKTLTKCCLLYIKIFM